MDAVLALSWSESSWSDWLLLIVGVLLFRYVVKALDRLEKARDDHDARLNAMAKGMRALLESLDKARPIRTEFATDSEFDAAAARFDSAKARFSFRMAQLLPVPWFPDTEEH